jgi:tetratricopeptide (TPR) repeat protein
MKILQVFFVLFIATNSLNAQSLANFYNAQEFYLANEFEKAKLEIDIAVRDERSAKKAKTWFFQGKIYYALASNKESALTTKERAKYFAISTEAFKKTKELDKKGEFPKDIYTHQVLLNHMLLTEGVSSFNEKDYSAAAQYFELSEVAAMHLGNFDTLAAYNAGLSYEKLGQIDKAIAKYQKCADVDYRGAMTYYFMYFLLHNDGQVQKSRAALAEGRVKYPNNRDLLNAQLNIYLQSGNSEQALTLINESIAMDPSNPQLYIIRGSVKEALDKSGTSIINDYQKAIDLDPQSFDGNYNIGAYYFNMAVDLIKESNDVDDLNESSRMVELANGDFRSAVPFLERALEIMPDSRQTLSSLKTLYLQLEMTDKYSEIKEALEK